MNELAILLNCGSEVVAFPIFGRVAQLLASIISSLFLIFRRLIDYYRTLVNYKPFSLQYFGGWLDSYLAYKLESCSRRPNILYKVDGNFNEQTS